MYARVKYNRDKDLKRRQLWLFGLKERESGKTYMELVRARNAATLLRIIYQRVRPGSIIYSDLWKAYEHISKVIKFL